MFNLLRRKGRFVLASVVTMVILHGNTKQFWPKIPYFQLRDESVAEHTRLIFNTLALVTLGQLLLGRLPRERLTPRLSAIGIVAPAVGPLVLLGRRGLRLRPPLSEVFNLSQVVLLPLLAAVLEDAIAALVLRSDQLLDA